MRRLGNLAVSCPTSFAALLAVIGVVAVTASSGSAVQAAGARSPHAARLAWHETVLDPDQSFRGLDAVDRRTAWVTGGSATDGAPGRVFRTTDGGATWQDVTPPGTEGLLLRDVEARGARTAVVLAIGPGEASRIFRTHDGGATWREAFRNDDPAAFYDCLGFYADGRHGLAMSDPVDGKFRILATRDGGRSWRVLPSDGMPEAPTEYGFAASGDCLITAGRSAYFGSGGGAARVFRSDDFGRTWTATDSAIPAGEAAGVFALAFRTPWRGLAVGGDFAEPADGIDAVAATRDGSTWATAGDLAHLAEDVAYLPRHRGGVLVVGESGDVAATSLSHDGGRTWRQISDVGFHALDCTPDGSCWGAGGGGRVGTLERSR